MRWKFLTTSPVVYEAQGRYDDAIKILQDLLKKTEKAGQQLLPGRPQQSRHLY